MWRGIVLAGGRGTRLYPTTLAVSKQLLPVYDTPMIYFPINTLMTAGIREILIISDPQDIFKFQRLLGSGEDWGVSFGYAVQPSPEGIAQALLIGKEYLAGSSCALVLGDNIFYGQGLRGLFSRAMSREEGATIFACQVRDPARYGVVSFDAGGKVLDIEEKPTQPKSSYAVTGLYFFDKDAPTRAAELRPSARGELEITDLNCSYLKDSRLHLETLERGCAWLDVGTYDSLLDASHFVATIERRQGMKVACPEEVALLQGWIGKEKVMERARMLGKNSYGDYLRRLVQPGSSGPMGEISG